MEENGNEAANVIGLRPAPRYRPRFRGCRGRPQFPRRPIDSQSEGEDEMAKFTDDLLKEKIFHCQICDELCTSDIFLVKDKGNVCANCFEEKCGEEMKSRAELNTALILILAKLMLPTYLECVGCEERLKSKKYSKHIATCDFKIKPCPMKNLEGCDWSGIEKSEENMEYTVVHKSTQEQNNKELKTVGTLTKLNGYYDEQNLDNNPNATEVDIDLLKHLADENNMLLNEFNLNPKGIDENMLKLLECPVCMDVMRPPIYLCNSGHGICIVCRGKVSECPTCKDKWTNVRNFFMEHFTTNSAIIKNNPKKAVRSVDVGEIVEFRVVMEENGPYASDRKRGYLWYNPRRRIPRDSLSEGEDDMENETMNKFTDDLLKEKIFHCQICDELCTSDIFLVKDKGNVCANCFEEKCGEETKSRAELNTALILILAKLMLPCKFKSKGCEERFKSKKYSKHIATCDFKIKPCPMKNLEGCDWSGSDFEVSEHLLKNHQNHVIKSENNIFKVETSLSKPFNVKLFSDDNQNCLLKTSVVDNKFYYSLNTVEKSEENMEYTVVHKSTQEPHDKELKTVGTLTKLNGYYDEQNLDKNPNATVLDIDLLKHLADENNMLLNEFNLNPKGIDENMLKLLECPVCMDVMRPPIYLCNRGHGICIVCRGEVSECPTCKDKWTNVRNFFMEHFTTNVKYPCSEIEKPKQTDIDINIDLKKNIVIKATNESNCDNIESKISTNKTDEQNLGCEHKINEERNKENMDLNTQKINILSNILVIPEQKINPVAKKRTYTSSVLTSASWIEMEEKKELIKLDALKKKEENKKKRDENKQKRIEQQQNKKKKHHTESKEIKNIEEQDKIYKESETNHSSTSPIISNICDELCTSDIFLVKGKGNVCGKCLEEKCGEEIKSRAELITPLMLIMAKLMLPCKFQSKGCDERVDCKNYSKHIGSCDFNIKPCPMKNLKGCDWTGSDFEVSGHLLKNHQDHVIKSGNNIFKVKTSLSEPFNVKLFSDDYQNCLLKTSVVDNKLYYSLNPLGKSEENMEYTVVHKNTQEQNNKELKTVGTLTKLNGYYDEQNLDKNPNATVVDIDLLKHLVDKNNMILNEFNLNRKGIDEDTLKLLECPVCMNLMRPPIYQCNRGHSICITCRGEVSACPTCKGNWTNSRNFFMENCTTNVKYPCKFKKFGCKVTGVEGEIKKHEEICSDSLISCRFYNFGCKERGVKSEIMKHEESCMVNKHKCPVCPAFPRINDISNHVEYKHRNCILKNQWYMIQKYSKCHGYKVYDSRLFRISYHTEDAYVYFAAELICPNGDPSEYFYEVGFCNNISETVDRSMTSTCLKEEPLVPGFKIKGNVKIHVDDFEYFVVFIKGGCNSKQIK
ncbi:unnamed protein product [Brassicogethes aeneus]|uniref:RING-type E3 ubiquitin transferase n=1 Tax=Brassicogethes aeneus TaxID=1431903 RepID=A0A9P0FDF6_BRAAE|nr:unnamed protein product [Brassicogethes aeneus]